MTTPVDRPVITPGILARFAAYKADHPAWGSLHIVLDDDNLENHNVAFCVEWAHEHDDAEGEELARILLSMTRTQRGRIDRRVRKMEFRVKLDRAQTPEQRSQLWHQQYEL